MFFKITGDEAVTKILAYLLMAFLVFGFAKGTYEYFTGDRTIKQTPTPAVEQKTDVKKVTGSAFMLESRNAIENVTKHYVTDTWPMEYDEHELPDGRIDTHGFCEIDDDGIKRQFWVRLDNTGKKVLRVKIDAQLLYSVDGK